MNIKTTFSGVVTLKATALHSATFSSVVVSHPHLLLVPLSLLLRLDSHIARPSAMICHMRQRLRTRCTFCRTSAFSAVKTDLREREGERGRERGRERESSTTLFYKDCSLGSVKT